MLHSVHPFIKSRNLWLTAIERGSSGNARAPGRMGHPAPCLRRGVIRPAYVVRMAADGERSRFARAVPINGHTGPGAASAAIRMHRPG